MPGLEKESMIQVVVPDLKSIQSSSTKGLVLSVLATEHPLRAKQIWQRLDRGYGKRLSYKTVYEVLQELNDTRVLCKQGKEWQIDPAWALRVKQFVVVLEKSYAKPELQARETLQAREIAFARASV